MASLIYVNGEFVPADKAKLSVLDHGLLFGDGVFEGVRVYNGIGFRLNRHLERLWQSAKSIWLNLPIPVERLASLVEESIEKNKLGDGYIRIVVTRGVNVSPLLVPGVTPFADGAGATPILSVSYEPSLIIIADTISLYPSTYYSNGLHIVTAKTSRNSPNALSPRIKSLNYLNNILAKIETYQGDYAEALMLDHLGEVAECTADNIFVVRRGRLQTPPVSAGILEGVTREVVLEIASEAGIPNDEINMSRDDVLSADECFLTGTAAEIVSVVKVDDNMIGTGKPGPITIELSRRFQKMVRPDRKSN